jgi:leucyl aminopeptidase (aminopeptidase T)
MHSGQFRVDEVNAERGAENLATSCLRVKPGERVHVVSFDAGDLFDVVSRAIERAGGIVVHVPLDAFVGEGGMARAKTQLPKQLADATASMLLAPNSLPTELSVLVAQTAMRTGSRHLHMPRMDLRTLGLAARADPDKLAQLNERIANLVRGGVRATVTSEAGTQLEIAFGPQYPPAAANGRPAPGSLDNLPSGFVDVHPVQFSGVFIADRAVLLGGLRPQAGTLRRTPMRATFKYGRLDSWTCADADVSTAVRNYLASHADAARVGFVTFPTNYLARTEVGNELQDGLLPGLNVCLGYSDAERTRAPYNAPVQMRLLGRKLNVEIGGKRIVTAGRFEDSLVEGIDPFR